MDEQEEGSNCNEDSGDDDSFETLDPNIVSQLIVDEQLTKHLFNANRKQENWGFVTAVSGDLAFLSTNARSSNSTSISAEMHPQTVSLTSNFSLRQEDLTINQGVTVHVRNLVWKFLLFLLKVRLL